MDEREVCARAQTLRNELLAQFERYDDVVGTRGFGLYEAQDSDVVVDTYLKSGTTLTQQLMYQLLCAAGRVEGDAAGEAFDDISEVVPFIDACHATGVVVPRNKCAPRCFKSHSRADKFDGRQRYIYCFREPRRVIASLVDFTMDWTLPHACAEPDPVRAQAYRLWVADQYLGTRTWYEHVKSWRDAKRRGARVLFLEYDDMVRDLDATIRTVAAFMDVPVTDQVLATVRRKCARDHMVPDVRFNDLHISDVMGWNKKLGNRVRPVDAKSFKSVEFGADLLAEFRSLYKTVLDVEDYAELKRTLLEMNGKQPM